MSLSDGYGTNAYFPCPILAWQFLGLLKLNLRLFFFFEKLFEVFTYIRIQGFIFFKLKIPWALSISGLEYLPFMFHTSIAYTFARLSAS
jgi:hypothetical protein